MFGWFKTKTRSQKSYKRDPKYRATALQRLLIKNPTEYSKLRKRYTVDAYEDDSIDVALANLGYLIISDDLYTPNPFSNDVSDGSIHPCYPTGRSTTVDDGPIVFADPVPSSWTSNGTRHREIHDTTPQNSISIETSNAQVEVSSVVSSTTYTPSVESTSYSYTSSSSGSSSSNTSSDTSSSSSSNYSSDSSSSSSSSSSDSSSSSSDW